MFGGIQADTVSFNHMFSQPSIGVYRGEQSGYKPNLLAYNTLINALRREDVSTPVRSLNFTRTSPHIFVHRSHEHMNFISIIQLS
jgi:hypothetical protein